MKVHRFSAALIVCLASTIFLASSAFAVSWTSWDASTFQSGAAGSASGKISLGTGDVNVALNGLAYQLVKGDYYYNNSSTGYTSPTGTYGGLAPSDLIQERYTGRVNISFSSAIVNPYISLVSVGQPSNYWVHYDFDGLQYPIQVVSSGGNYWGYNGYSILGNTFSGREFNGILKLQGTYTNLSFALSPNEYWHGFNVGVESAAPVPEPTTMVLLGAGLLGLVAYRRKLKK